MKKKKKDAAFQGHITSSKSFSPHIHQVSHNLSLYMPLCIRINFPLHCPVFTSVLSLLMTPFTS